MLQKNNSLEIHLSVLFSVTNKLSSDMVLHCVFVCVCACVFFVELSGMTSGKSANCLCSFSTNYRKLALVAIIILFRQFVVGYLSRRGVQLMMSECCSGSTWPTFLHFRPCIWKFWFSLIWYV